MLNKESKQKTSTFGMIFSGILIIGFNVFVLNYCSILMNNVSF